MNKYEQLIEHIINDNEAAAKELFHQIVVEKSRDIYESLMDEEMGGNPANQFVNDVTQEVQGDEQGIGEDDEEMGEITLGGDDEFGGDDEEETFGGEEGGDDVSSKIDELEAQLAELKAMLDVDGDGDHDMEDHEEGSEGGDEFGASDFDSEEGMGDEEGPEQFGEGKNPFAKSGSGKSASGKSGSGAASGKSGSGKAASGKSGSGVKESRKLSDVEIMKEYVDKIGEIYKQEPAGSEGKEVANGGSATVTANSVVAGKNDMGGSTANIAKGGANADPSGTPSNKPSGLLKSGGEIKSGNMNVPGGKAGNAFSTKAKAKTGEEGGVNDNSPLAK
jgi:hypothetical protein